MIKILSQTFQSIREAREATKKKEKEKGRRSVNKRKPHFVVVENYSNFFSLPN